MGCLLVATPHSSLSQMAVGTRQQELLNSERLSQCVDEWMGDHVFTVLFLGFCFQSEIIGSIKELGSL